MAGPTPGGPEIDHRRASFQLVERAALTFEAFEEAGLPSSGFLGAFFLQAHGPAGPPRGTWVRVILECRGMRLFSRVSIMGPFCRHERSACRVPVAALEATCLNRAAPSRAFKPVPGHGPCGLLCCKPRRCFSRANHLPAFPAIRSTKPLAEPFTMVVCPGKRVVRVPWGRSRPFSVTTFKARSSGTCRQSTIRGRQKNA